MILGRPSLAEPEEQVAAAARILADLPGVAFLSALRRANVHGALDMGLAPGVLPGRVALEAGRAWYEHHWAAPLPAARGLDTAGIMEAASRGRIGGLVLLGADPRRDFPDAQLALKAMLGARFVVAVDTHLTASCRAADVILPAATWAERRGTFTNLEDRITWLSHLVTAPGGGLARLGDRQRTGRPPRRRPGLLQPRGDLGRGHPAVSAAPGRVATRPSPARQARDGSLVPQGPPGNPLAPRVPGRSTPWPIRGSPPPSCTTWPRRPCCTPSCHWSPNPTAPRRPPPPSWRQPAGRPPR